MEIKVTEREENPLLDRVEINFKVDHTNAPTPPRSEVLDELSDEMGVHKGLVVIEKLATPHGRQVASGIARIYRSRSNLEEFEPRYLLERTGILDIKVEEEAEIETGAEAEKEEEPEEAGKEEEEAEEEVEEEEEEIDYESLSDETISDIKDKAKELELDYQKLLEAEKENKDRKTLKQWLENKIE